MADDIETDRLRVDPVDRLSWCNTNLSVRLTAGALLGDETQTDTITTWIDIAHVPDERIARLDLQYWAGVQVAEAIDPETARAFLRGLNPIAGDVRLIDLIAQDPESSEETRNIVDDAVDGFLE